MCLIAWENTDMTRDLGNIAKNLYLKENGKVG